MLTIAASPRDPFLLRNQTMRNLKRVVRVSEDFLTPQNHYFDFREDEAGLCGGNFLLISVFRSFVFCCKYHAVIQGGKKMKQTNLDKYHSAYVKLFLMRIIPN